jgi:DNA-binding IclR family transcriptional regulator
MATTDGVSTLDTTETSLRVVSKLKELDGAGVTELAEALDIAPSTAHSHLTTLRENRYVVKEGDTYRLGLKFLDFGQYVRANNDYYSLAESKVERLSEETGARTHFIVEEHGQGVYVFTGSGKHGVETFARDGRRMELHSAAAGKAILAYLPEERVHEIIDEWGLEQRTAHTITDRDELFEELEEIRGRDGIGFNLEEQIVGIRAVGAPVRTPDGTVIGALSVSGPAHRMKGDRLYEELPDIVLGTANELELEIEYA